MDTTSLIQFARSVEANLAYWRRQMGELNDENRRQMDQDWQNVYRATEFGLGLTETWREAAEFIIELFDYVDQRSHWREWIPMLEQVVEGCPQNDPTLKGEALNQLGLLYRRTRQMEKALETHLEEEKIGLTLGNTKRISYARLHQSLVYWRMRQYEPAEKAAKAALAGFIECKSDPKPQANALMALGLVNHFRGELAQAEEQMRQAVQLYRDSGGAISVTRALLNLGNILESAGKPDEALITYYEAISILGSEDHELDRTRLEHAIGTLHYHQGRLAEAEAAFQRANSPYMRFWGPLYVHAMTIMNLANVKLARGQHTEAEAFWVECIDLLRRANANVMLANSLGGLAETMVAKGDIKQALSLFDQSLDILSMYPDDAFAQKLDKMFREGREGALDMITERPSEIDPDGRILDLAKKDV